MPEAGRVLSSRYSRSLWVFVLGIAGGEPAGQGFCSEAT